MSAADMFLEDKKTDDRPYLTLGVRFSHREHDKDAHQSLLDYFRAGNGVSVFTMDAGQCCRDSLRRPCELGKIDVIICNVLPARWQFVYSFFKMYRRKM
ncbi:hypothetical protein TNCV_4102461 [Trichonephila clavipes]|nr:hypothetical protein TNCV_4102461 [Trichonephila clavipes]